MHGRWVLGLVTLIGIVALGITVGSSAKTEDRPPDIAPHLWHPLSDTVGIALREAPTMSGTPELHGTLMVRRDQLWQPVYLERSRDEITAVPAQ